MVPSVQLTRQAIVLYVPGDDPTPLSPGDWGGLQDALTAVARRHETGGKLVLVVDSEVRHGDMIAAMDAARGDGGLFPTVVLAGGAI